MLRPAEVEGTGHQNLKPQITHLRGFKAESITDQQWDLRRLRSASRCLRSWPTRTAAGGPGHGDLRTPLGYMLSPTPWFLLSFLSIASVCRKSGDNTGPCANSPRPLQPGCTRPRRQISCAKREPGSEVNPVPVYRAVRRCLPRVALPSLGFVLYQGSPANPTPAHQPPCPPSSATGAISRLLIQREGSGSSLMETEHKLGPAGSCWSWCLPCPALALALRFRMAPGSHSGLWPFAWPSSCRNRVGFCPSAHPQLTL
ncbi:uncharacterized protein LOC131486016 isoform X2 [Neofelis nebulosa]|uniref:uncharacterized protein LOC131486016 isoform X2 n=1 Tax=Neofelis nebulosa TaxID=61452 RepID=UPI00272A697B|nr:uncharacterized protein LOC131486016 isoform X2 [Neofelis nebulosa]